MNQVFVYGTLKRGFPNHDPYLSNAHFFGSYRTLKAYPMVIAGPYFIPCLVPEPGIGQQVSGELFEVDAKGLALLDDLESTDRSDGYHRQIIKVQRLHGDSHPRGADIVDANVYFKHRVYLGELHSAMLASYHHDRRYIAALDRS